MFFKKPFIVPCDMKRLDNDTLLLLNFFYEHQVSKFNFKLEDRNPTKKRAGTKSKLLQLQLQLQGLMTCSMKMFDFF